VNKDILTRDDVDQGDVNISSHRVSEVYLGDVALDFKNPGGIARYIELDRVRTPKNTFKMLHTI
jgi:hypothetical protein